MQGLNLEFSVTQNSPPMIIHEAGNFVVRLCRVFCIAPLPRLVLVEAQLTLFSMSRFEGMWCCRSYLASL